MGLILQSLFRLYWSTEDKSYNTCAHSLAINWGDDMSISYLYSHLLFMQALSVTWGAQEEEDDGQGCEFGPGLFGVGAVQ